MAAASNRINVFPFGTQYRSTGPRSRYLHMVQLVRNGYIGELKHIDVWCRDVSHNESQYHVKPYGSDVEIPVPDGFDYDAWMGPAEMVPYTADRATQWGGFHCPETSLGFIAGCGIHELGLAQWANQSDTICHLSDIAARTGREIRWNPETEAIIGDPDAAKMLTRPTREKWRVW